MGDIKVNSIEQAAQFAPAIIGTSRAEHLTDRYQVAPTAEIVQTLGAHGWELAAVSSLSKRTKNPETAKHGLRLVNRALAPTESGDLPQLVLRNAHDGTSSLWMRIGFYRFACANQTVVGSTVGNVRILHRDYSRSVLLDAIAHLLDRLPAAMAALSSWQAFTPTQEAKAKYLEQAAALRWDAEEFSVRIGERARRYEDRGETAYHLFQRAQEDLIRGRVTVVTKETRAIRRARAVGALDESTRINTGLWDLTSAMVAA